MNQILVPDNKLVSCNFLFVGKMGLFVIYIYVSYISLYIKILSDFGITALQDKSSRRSLLGDFYDCRISMFMKQ